MKTALRLDGVKALAGQDLGEGAWRVITQDQVNMFADATDDHQWIHVDVARAQAGPFGAPIAHGFLTLSLVPALMHEVLAVDGVRMAINYGINRVRFISPLRVGSRVRARGRCHSVEEVEGGVQVVNQVTIEIEGREKPACVAETISRYYS